MKNQKSIYLGIGAVIILGLMVYGLNQNYFKKQNQPSLLSPTAPVVNITQQKSTNDTSSWTLYTNKTYGYSIKFPVTYTVPPQTAKEISQLGIDNNMGVERKSDPNGSSVIGIDVYPNKENVSLTDFMNKNSKMYGITGPLISYNFNGYNSLFNKNQPGTNVFVKQGQYIYHITAPTASSDTEIGNIVTTFKFTQ